MLFWSIYAIQTMRAASFYAGLCWSTGCVRCAIVRKRERFGRRKWGMSTAHSRHSRIVLAKNVDKSVLFPISFSWYQQNVFAGPLVLEPSGGVAVARH